MEPWTHSIEYPKYMGYLHGEHGRVLATMLDRLSGVPGAFPENTTVVFISDRSMPAYHPVYKGAWHHGNAMRYGALVLSSNRSLRTGGRYLRWPIDNKRLGALWCTLGHVLGAPMDMFGNWSGGPLAELL
jgi:hypothetical protein